MILQEAGKSLTPVPRIEFATEKELQTLIEGNLESVFGCRFVATEFSTGSVHSGRIDTLALSEENNPVIIEYKKVENSGLVMQALFYLDWLKDHKGDFKLAVEQSLGKTEVDWSNIRVICLAPSFDRYSQHAVAHLGVNLELWQYKRYANGVLEIEEKFRSSAKGTTSTATKPSKPETSPTSISEYTVEKLLQKTNPETLELFRQLDEYVLSLNESIRAVPQKYYVAYKFAKNVVCVDIQGKKLKIWLNLPAGSPRVGWVSDVTGVGHLGTGNQEFNINDQTELEQAFELINEAYLLAGGD